MASGLWAQVWLSSLLRTLRPRPRVWGDGRGVCPTSSWQGTSGAPPRRPLGSILPHPRPHPGGSPAQPCPGRLCGDCAFPICASFTKCSEAEVMARGRQHPASPPSLLWECKDGSTPRNLLRSRVNRWKGRSLRPLPRWVPSGRTGREPRPRQGGAGG